MQIRKFWAILIFLIFIASLFAVTKVYYSLKIWTFPGPPTVFEIKNGDSFGRINSRLYNKKIIYSARVFHRYAQINNKINKMKAGKFLINEGQNMISILKTLTQGKSIETRITIPEGKNLYEIAKILESKNITNADKFIQLSKNIDFVNSLSIPGPTVEGYLYPETYYFPEKITAQIVIHKMVREFHKKTKPLNFSNSKLNKKDIIILASIVEKETGAKHERPLIAGVFHNRLIKKMRLQSDPTTIYGIFEHYNGNLQKKHLLELTPYNTYRISGLPKGPISNPGIDAIKAVLHPPNHNYYYFVSKNDGTHIFSENYQNHLKAVDKWQKNRRNRKGKSWRNLKH